jgi:hypothetical protein
MAVLVDARVAHKSAELPGAGAVPRVSVEAKVLRLLRVNI